MRERPDPTGPPPGHTVLLVLHPLVGMDLAWDPWAADSKKGRPEGGNIQGDLAMRAAVA